MRTTLATIVLIVAELPALVWVLFVLLAQWIDPASVNEADWLDDNDEGDGPYGI